MSKPLRILTIGHAYILGINRALPREIARDPRFEVTVGAPNFFHGDLRPLAMEPEPVGSPLNVVGMDARWTRFIHVFHYRSRSLHELVGCDRYDIIHVWEEPYVYAGYQLCQAARKAGKKTRYCFHTAQNLSKRYPPPFGFFERRCVTYAHRWIAGGELVRETMSERGYDPERGCTMALAVDTHNFQPLDQAIRRTVLNEIGLQSPIVGFMGRLTQEKGIGVLLRALEMLPETQPWSALFLGSGPLESSIRQWAQAKGWTNRIHVRLAKHDEVPRYLGAMDLLVAPSQTTPVWKEQFGRMIIEAFACGVPVLASDSGEIPYVVGQAGTILPEKDAAAWTQAILGLLTNPARRSKMAALGQERAVQFSAESLAVKCREMFLEMAEVSGSAS